MIPRYTRPVMATIWDAQTRCRIWFEIEAHAADAMAELGVIPKTAAKTIWEKGKEAKFDLARIEEIEREKERIKLDRERQGLEKTLSGIKGMNRLPDSVFVIDVRKEEIAVAVAGDFDAFATLLGDLPS